MPALIDALVAALQASDGLSGVNVVDGPLVSNSAASEWVFVGYDGDPGGEFQATSTLQEWAGIGAKAKNEEITLTCCALVRSGSTSVKPVRDRAYQIFAAVEAAVRSNPALALPPPTVCSISEHTFFPEQTANGLQGRLPFTVTCTTRI
ncbi:hypothetical protein GTY41_03780 [Streptomyces sp. SID685]|uniref:hypothetical protein n=1 Tax=Streptomyces sp. SID685 TaxID=2690322 RepID=UPI0014063E06|nr:hypothetical protein [Streptomyces sp. SID685]MYR84085.1 hypothetical protein [Streptomyces sp. SID685]